MSVQSGSTSQQSDVQGQVQETDTQVQTPSSLWSPNQFAARAKAKKKRAQRPVNETGMQRLVRLSSNLAPLLLLVMALVLYYFPARWVSDLGPDPDASEYTLGALNLIHGKGYSIILHGVTYPPRYTFGFSLVLIPFLVIFGPFVGHAIYAVYVSAVGCVIGTYFVTRKVAGSGGAFVAGFVVLCSVAYHNATYNVMPDVTNVALLTVLIFLTYQMLSEPETPRSSALAYIVVCALLSSIRFTNLPLILVNLALIAIHIMRGRMSKAYYPYLLLSFSASALPTIVYNFFAFGGPTKSGYTFWLPEYFRNFHNAFAWTYFHSARFLLPAPREGNGYFFGRALRGDGDLLPSFFLAVALIGVILYVVRHRRYTMAKTTTLDFVLISAVIHTITYTLFFWQSDRFLLPLIPAIAIFIGIGVQECVFRRISFRSLPATAVVLGLLIVGGVESFHAVVQQTPFLYNEKILGIHGSYELRYDLDQTFDSRCTSTCIVVSPDPPTYTEYIVRNALALNPGDISKDYYNHSVNGPTVNTLTADQKLAMIANALKNHVPVFYDLRVVKEEPGFYAKMIGIGEQRVIQDRGTYAMFELAPRQ